MTNLQKGVTALVAVGVTGIGAVATSAEPGLGIVVMGVVASLGIVAWATDRIYGPQDKDGD